MQRAAKEVGISMDTSLLGGYLAVMELIEKGGTNSSAAGLVHHAFLYRTVDEYLRTIVSHVRGDGTGQPPALVAVPGRQLPLLRALLDDDSQKVTFFDIDDLGRNPARMTAVMGQFVHRRPTLRPRLVSEAVGGGQPASTYQEIVLHEALLAGALAGTTASVLCPINARGLPAGDARRCGTHPSRTSSPTGSKPPVRRTTRRSRPRCSTAPYQGVSPTADERTYHHGELADVRHFVEAGATRAGLPAARVQDLVLAVNEVATNTLVHTESPGVFRLWVDTATREVICDLCDHGHIAEPLTGRMAPSPLSRHGWGLWMVNQVCDLVETRSGGWGTNIRIHMGLGPRF